MSIAAKSSIASYSTESMMKFLHVCNHSKLVLEEEKVVNNIIRRTSLL